jgi:hypothetical protein
MNKFIRTFKIRFLIFFFKILEKSFIENPYPDPKKREELAKLCNCCRNTNDLSDRERVTEQIVTHWFQNKRKLTRRGKNRFFFFKFVT